MQYLKAINLSFANTGLIAEFYIDADQVGKQLHEDDLNWKTKVLSNHIFYSAET